MSKTKKSKTFIKIIYFDEGSATDLLYILGGGKSTDKEEKIVTKTTQLAAGAEAQEQGQGQQQCDGLSHGAFLLFS